VKSDFDVAPFKREELSIVRAVLLEWNLRALCMDARRSYTIMMVRSHGEDRFMICFEKATEGDIPELMKIMKKAFDDEAIRFKGNPEGGGPPGYDDGSFLMKWGFTGDGQNSSGSLYKILVETEKAEKLVGAFIVFIGEKDGSPGDNTLGTIFVDPEWQDRGIGSQAMQYLLATFPAKRWVLGTPEWATRNHHFYEKNSFTKIREVLDPELDKEKGGAYSYIYERVTKA
jgi:ribosomal protein S18 acetylase RimI-like enzyme